jgi:hypothetical protein
MLNIVQGESFTNLHLVRCSNGDNLTWTRAIAWGGMGNGGTMVHCARQRKVGPFSALELQQLARHGLLKPGEHVWLEGSQRWLEANAVPGLFTRAGEKKFWLTLKEATHGPFVVDQIRAGLNTHQFTLETQACADDTPRWMPLGQLPEFRDFKLETIALTGGRARLLAGSLEFEEAVLYRAGKNGDLNAKLISTFMDLKRRCAHNPALAASIEETIAALQAKHQAEAELRIPDGPPTA